MKKIACCLLGLAFCFTLIFTASTVFAWGTGCSDGTCYEIVTSGDVTISAGQYQQYFPEVTGENGAHTAGDAVQTIEAWGHGDHQTAVNAEGQVVQYEPFHADFQGSLGNAEHSGDSYMNVYGSAGTNPWCRSLGIDIISGGDFTTQTSMTEHSMDSSIANNIFLDANMGGAKNTTGFGVLNDQITGYSQERNDGSWQQGMTRTTIQSGTLPQ
jgi:hypothetical protein